VRQQELIVKNGITRDGLTSAAIRETRIVPVDWVTVPSQEPALPLEDLFAEAIRNRPDLNQAGIQVETSRISLQASRNAVKPELDVVGIMQNSALSGDLNPGAGPFLPGAPLTPGGYGTAIEQILRRNYPTYGIGVQLLLPLRNRVAQADAVRDELQLRQSEVRRKQLENQIRLEVADVHVTLLAARAAYDAAVQARILQEESVNVEQQKFAVGISTNLQVIQFQTFLAQARSTELASKGAYAKAKIALDRALARTLEVNQVSINEAIHGQVARASTPVGGR
jgi:outer membrane protein TolC